MARRGRGDPLQRVLAPARRGRGLRDPRRARSSAFELSSVLSSAGTADDLDRRAAGTLELEAEALELGRATDQRLMRRRRAASSSIGAQRAAATSRRPPVSRSITRSNSTRSCATC